MPLPKWMQEPKTIQRKTQNRRSARQEQRRADDIGGRTQAGSGSSWRAPQDVKNDTFMEQIKYTDAASFRLTVAEWRKLRADADRAGLEPRMVVDFPGSDLRIVITEEPLPPG